MEVNGGERGGLKNENRWPNRLWDETPAVAGVGSIQKRQQSAPPYYVFSSTLPLTNPTYLFCYPSTSPPLFALNPPNPLLLPLLLLQPPRHVRISPLELSSQPSLPFLYSSFYAEPEDSGDRKFRSCRFRPAVIESRCFSFFL